MNQQAPDTAIFLTRADVARLLRLTPRSVDRLAASGDLEKVKLGKSRSGFHRDSVGEYLAKMNASASSSASPSANQEFTLGAIPGHVGDQYGSRGLVVHIKAEWDGLAEVAEALDGWLGTNGLPGCFVMAGNGAISVMWAKSIGYRPDQVRAAIDKVRASVVHA